MRQVKLKTLASREIQILTEFITCTGSWNWAITGLKSYFFAYLFDVFKYLFNELCVHSFVVMVARAGGMFDPVSTL